MRRGTSNSTRLLNYYCISEPTQTNTMWLLGIEHRTSERASVLLAAKPSLQFPPYFHTD